MPSVEELQKEHHQLCRAMQSGVKQDIETTGSLTSSVTPKHLRVGMNVALCDQSAMVKLLVEKGIITEDEIWTKLVEEMRLEVKRYEVLLTERMGMNITLG